MCVCLCACVCHKNNDQYVLVFVPVHAHVHISISLSLYRTLTLNVQSLSGTLTVYATTAVLCVVLCSLPLHYWFQISSYTQVGHCDYKLCRIRFPLEIQLHPGKQFSQI